MYQYDVHDHTIVRERAEQFGDQVRRRLSGELTEDEFKPLRLQNGLYMQLHAYMLRVAIPYGLLSSRQVRKLAHITRTYDEGYLHFTTRTNAQLNWPELRDVPEILAELATVEMHAIQSSGNCIRNITSDPFAGVARDEIEDPRPYCEILRQWSTFHPEFAFLPRKFKIAVTGASEDRAAIRVHDIGLRLVEDGAGALGFEVWVGGGQGRTPVLAERIRDFLSREDLLSYVEAVLRVYNRHGRRDNKTKARIKILVQALGAEVFGAQVEEEWRRIRGSGLRLEEEEIERFRAHFAPPPYEAAPPDGAGLRAALLNRDRDFARWFETNVVEHRQAGYAIAVISLKSPERPPGDMTAEQLDAVAFLADRYSFGRIRVTHRQNLVLPDVRLADLHELWRSLSELGIATPNFETVTDVIACPGLDYCNLANARSLSVAEDVGRRFRDSERSSELGRVTVNISGCINACGHHHVGNIGVLGIDKGGTEHYQLMVGGSAGHDASFGTVLGRALTHDQVGEAVEALLSAYLELRSSAAESFLETYRRVGARPFQEAVYADH